MPAHIRVGARAGIQARACAGIHARACARGAIRAEARAEAGARAVCIGTATGSRRRHASSGARQRPAARGCGGG